MNVLPNILSFLLATANAGSSGGGFWMPRQGSTIAESVDWIFFFIYWICVFFFILIVGLMVLFVIKYRRRPGRESEPSPTHNTPLELTWTAIPLILVIAIFYVGLKGYVGLTTVPQNAYEVYVTGYRWSWTFEHRNGAVETAELTVPANRPVKLIMTSEDVLHSMFIPEFRVKKDAVPGRYNYLWFEAEPGTYQAFCAEYCGTEHSQMTATVRVLPQEEFDAQIANLANWIDDYGEEELYKAGYRLYARCQSCHSLDGSVKTGPSFRETYDKWGEARALMSGESVTIDENYVRNSILNPGSQIASPYGNVMPSFQGQLKEREVRALIEFIKRLDEVVDEQGEPRIDLEAQAGGSNS